MKVSTFSTIATVSLLFIAKCGFCNQPHEATFQVQSDQIQESSPINSLPGSTLGFLQLNLNSTKNSPNAQKLLGTLTEKLTGGFSLSGDNWRTVVAAGLVQLGMSKDAQAFADQLDPRIVLAYIPEPGNKQAMFDKKSSPASVFDHSVALVLTDPHADILFTFLKSKYKSGWIQGTEYVKVSAGSTANFDITVIDDKIILASEPRIFGSFIQSNRLHQLGLHESLADNKGWKLAAPNLEDNALLTVAIAGKAIGDNTTIKSAPGEESFWGLSFSIHDDSEVISATIASSDPATELTPSGIEDLATFMPINPLLQVALGRVSKSGVALNFDSKKVQNSKKETLKPVWSDSNWLVDIFPLAKDGDELSGLDFLMIGQSVDGSKPDPIFKGMLDYIAKSEEHDPAKIMEKTTVPGADMAFESRESIQKEIKDSVINDLPPEYQKFADIVKKKTFAYAKVGENIFASTSKKLLESAIDHYHSYFQTSELSKSVSTVDLQNKTFHFFHFAADPKLALSTINSMFLGVGTPFGMPSEISKLLSTASGKLSLDGYVNPNSFSLKLVIPVPSSVISKFLEKAK